MHVTNPCGNRPLRPNRPWRPPAALSGPFPMPATAAATLTPPPAILPTIPPVPRCGYSSRHRGLTPCPIRSARPGRFRPALAPGLRPQNSAPDQPAATQTRPRPRPRKASPTSPGDRRRQPWAMPPRNRRYPNCHHAYARTGSRTPFAGRRSRACLYEFYDDAFNPSGSISTAGNLSGRLADWQDLRPAYRDRAESIQRLDRGRLNIYCVYHTEDGTGEQLLVPAHLPEKGTADKAVSVP
jgi:hypothetical protein